MNVNLIENYFDDGGIRWWIDLAINLIRLVTNRNIELIGLSNLILKKMPKRVSADYTARSVYMIDRYSISMTMLSVCLSVCLSICHSVSVRPSPLEKNPVEYYRIVVVFSSIL